MLPWITNHMQERKLEEWNKTLNSSPSNYSLLISLENTRMYVLGSYKDMKRIESLVLSSQFTTQKDAYNLNYATQGGGGN